MRRTTFIGGVVLLAALGGALRLDLPARAQELKATLKGSVSVPAGGPAAGIAVKLSLKDSDQPPRTSNTSDQGEYLFESLPPGLYKLTVEATGYKSIILEDVELAGGDVQELRFTLEAGSPQETINIAPDVYPTPTPTPAPPAP